MSAPPLSFKVVVRDGSGARAIARRLHASDAWSLAAFMREGGRGVEIRHASTDEIVVRFDDELGHPPNEG